MKSFPAQLKTDEHLIDVLVRVDEANVEIRSGSTTLGRWPRSECHFERHAPTSYRFSADGETVNMRIVDDGGFRQALEYVRTERVSIVPRPLVVAGLAAIMAAVAFTMLGGVPEPAAAEAVPTTVVAAPTSTAAPATTLAIVAEAPTSISDRWNAIAGGTPLQLGNQALTTISSTLSIEVGADSVTVMATPTSPPMTGPGFSRGSASISMAPIPLGSRRTQSSTVSATASRTRRENTSSSPPAWSGDEQRRHLTEHRIVGAGAPPTPTDPMTDDARWVEPRRLGISSTPGPPCEFCGTHRSRACHDR